MARRAAPQSPLSAKVGKGCWADVEVACTQMQAFAAQVQGQDGQATRKILLYHNLPVAELSNVLQASFSVSSVVGVQDYAQDIFFPLSLLSRAPAYFSSRPPYRIVPGLEDDASPVAPAKGDGESLLRGRPGSSSDFGISQMQGSKLVQVLGAVAPGGHPLSRSQLDYAIRLVIGESDGDRAATDALVALRELFDAFDETGSGVTTSPDFLLALSRLADGRDGDTGRSGHGGGGSELGAAPLRSHGNASGSLPDLMIAVNGLGEGVPDAESRYARGAADNTAGPAATAAALAAANLAAATPMGSMSPGLRATLRDLQRLTGLADVGPAVAVAALARAAAPDGCGGSVVDEAAFAAWLRGTAALRGAPRPEPAVAVAVFELFAAAADGGRAVALPDLAAGIVVLCGGSRREKLAAVFPHYDADDDGRMTTAEVGRYMGSVFQVVFGTMPEMAAAMGTLGPAALGQATARQCMAETGCNDAGGGIDADTLHAWFLRPPDADWGPGQVLASAVEIAGRNGIGFDSSIGGGGGSGGDSGSGDDGGGAAPALSVTDLQRLTSLHMHDVSTIFELFAACADHQGLISRPAFNGCFRALIEVRRGRPTTGAERAELLLLLDALFAVFDDDGDGAVALGELASGLSVLCGGDADDKVRAAFELYDGDSDGYISREEMVSYLASVFKVLFAINPGMRDRMGGHSAEELATATAEQAFEEMDINMDGRLNSEEFRCWYNANSLSASLAGMEANDLPGGGDGDGAATAGDSGGGSGGDGDNGPGFTIGELQGLLRLHETHVDDVFGQMALASDEHGFIAEDAFRRELATLTGVAELPAAQRARAQTIIGRLFAVMDANGDGRVDFSELASGLTVLCGGTRDEKVRAAFNLYDVNGDGFIGVDEMLAYLTAVFRVLHASSAAVTSPRSGGAGDADGGMASPDDLAQAMVRRAFDEADADGDGRLSYEEFAGWYARAAALDPLSLSASIKAVVADAAPQAVRLLSLGEARRMARLEHLSAEDVFSAFCTSADDLGRLDRRTFHRCFRSLVCRGSGHTGSGVCGGNTGGSGGTGGGGEGGLEEADVIRAAARMADRLFDVFDANDDNFVDFSELASGLSVLCGGTRNERAKAAFDLFDLDGSGYITMGEMAAYLTSVFRVLYMLQPELRAAIGASPELLGSVTAEQAMADADADGDGLISFDEFSRWYGDAGLLASTGPGPALDGGSGTGNGGGAAGSAGAAEAAGYGARKKPAVEARDEHELAADAGAGGGGGQSGFNGAVNMATTAAVAVREAWQAEQRPAAAGGVSAFRQRAPPMPPAGANGYGNGRAPEAGSGVDDSSDEEAALDYGMPLPPWGGHGDARRLTRLDRFRAQDLHGMLASAADADGCVTRGDFFSCFDALVEWAEEAERTAARTSNGSGPTTAAANGGSGGGGTGGGISGGGDGGASAATDKLKLRLLLGRLFDAMDAADEGRVSVRELASGLGVLCGGSRDEKVRAAFELFATDHDGCISLQQMTRYLTSVFRVLYETSPGYEDGLGLEPERLAEAVTLQAFQDLGTGGDGRISFREFSRWYTRPDNVTSPPGGPAATGERGDGGGGGRGSGAARHGGGGGSSGGGGGAGMRRRRRSNRSSGAGGTADWREGPANTREDDGEIGGGGSCRLSGIAANSSMWDAPAGRAGKNAGSSRKRPARRRSQGRDGDDPAAATTDNGHRGGTSGGGGDGGEECNSAGDGGATAGAWPAEGMLRARQLLHLDSFSVDDMLEAMSEASVGGVLLQAAYLRCMRYLAQLGGAGSGGGGCFGGSTGGGGDGRDGDGGQQAQTLARRIFQAFDTDSDGRVEFTAITSGLSVLCAASMDEKISTAFALHDADGDGYVSFDEMAAYLASVFCILGAVSAASSVVGAAYANPEALSLETARQLYREAGLPPSAKIGIAQFRTFVRHGVGV